MYVQIVCTIPRQCVLDVTVQVYASMIFATNLTASFYYQYPVAVKKVKACQNAFYFEQANLNTGIYVQLSQIKNHRNIQL